MRVVVEKRPSGCGTWLAVTILLELAIEYWYVSLGVVAVVIVVDLVRAARQRELARPRAGPRDPWLNEVAVALADLGLREIARAIQGRKLGGARLDGDIGLEAERSLVYVNLFSDRRLAQQAELGQRAKLDVRDVMAKGATAVRSVDRVVFVASGRGTVVERVPSRRGRLRRRLLGRAAPASSGADRIMFGRCAAGSEVRCTEMLGTDFDPTQYKRHCA